MQFEITLYQLTAHEKVQVFELGAGDEKIPSACRGRGGVNIVLISKIQ